MGYETADMAQGYPFTYMSAANAIGLLEDVNMVASTDALRGEDAQVVYNALFVDYAAGAKRVNDAHGTTVESYPILAEQVWGLTRAAVGTWDENSDETATLEYCKAHTWVVLGADPTTEGNILAYAISDSDGDIYTEGKGTTYSFKYDGDASALAGYQVELWGEGNHGEPEWENKSDKYVWSEDWTIKAIKTVKGQTSYDYNASMADSKADNGEIVLDETTLDLDAVAANVENVDNAYAVAQYVVNGYHGLNKKDVDAKDVEAALNVRDGAQYKLVDWDSDGDIDWVVVSTANYYKVEAVNSTRLTVSSMVNTGDVEDQDESKNVTWKLDDTTDVNGVDYKYVTEEDLAEGDIIEVTYTVSSDDDAELVTATITKVEADTAELDKVSTKDDLELTFDGEVKKIADNDDLGDTVVPANPATYGQFDDEELGSQFNLWTNRNGFIVYSDYANEVVNYLMVLDTANGSDKTGDRKLAKADVLLADNSVDKDVEFAAGLTIDGKDDKTTGYNSDDRTWDETLVVGNVYKYWANEDGTITKMESMFSDEMIYDEKLEGYTYDNSTDRLKDASGSVASLEEAKVIFAVTEGYIKGDIATPKAEAETTPDLYVDAENVMAVKQSDIPDIGVDPEDAVITNATNVWVNNATLYAGATGMNFVAEVDGNGEASAAILGVENFNKFEDASTTVALVTSVSYDKNGVVTVEAAYNGEVTELASAEDVDFEDVVKEYDYSTTSDSGLTTKTAADMLKDSALYAEITTDADGVLTKVTFMDQNGINNMVGHYYEVTRRIITDVKSASVAYGQDNYFYNNSKNLYSVGRLNVDAKDLADEVDYYTIDGRPTSDVGYTSSLLSVVAGFEETPAITAETDSNLVESYVNDKFDDADTYYVADLAVKMGSDEIVAAYAFEDSLGEVDKAVSLLGDQKMQAGKSATFTVTAPAAQHVSSVSNVKVTDAKGNDVTTGAGMTVSESGADITIDLARDVATGDYTVTYDYVIGGETYSASFTLTVEAADVQKVDTIVDVNLLNATTFNFTVKDQAGDEIDGLADSVRVWFGAREITKKTVTAQGNGVYQVEVEETLPAAVEVSVDGSAKAELGLMEITNLRRTVMNDKSVLAMETNMNLPEDATITIWWQKGLDGEDFCTPNVTDRTNTQYKDYILTPEEGWNFVADGTATVEIVYGNGQVATLALPCQA